MGALERVGLVADDDAYFRIAVSAILMRHFGFSDVVEASTLDEAVEILSNRENICTALFDLSMPGVRSPTTLRTVRECFPNLKVSIISASNSRRDILLALEAGVHGYMPKQLSVSELTAALQLIFNGGIYVPPSLALMAPLSLEASPGPGRDPIVVNLPVQANAAHVLTARQQEVLDLLVQGKSNKEIALALNLGEGTVKIHVAAIFRHFGVNSRAAAAVAGAQPTLNRRRELSSVQ